MVYIWPDLANFLKKGESCVLATIVQKAGSAPRGPGAKMIIRKSGEIIGSVGGGKLEAEAMKGAAQSFRTGQSRLQTFCLTGKDAAETEMICGGEGEILLDFIDADNVLTVELFRALYSSIEKGLQCWFVTSLDQDGRTQRFFIKKDKTVIGQFEGSWDLIEDLLSDPLKWSVHSEIRNNHRIFIDPIQEREMVYIFGAGHVGKCIAPIAASVGFRTTVIDDRKDFADPLRFPGSEIIHPASLEDPLPELQWDENSYLIIVTRGHLNDASILEQVIHKPVAYIGMIGSKRKRDVIYHHLMTDCGIREEEIAFVHSPIGIDIAAETPEEIAISVVAELIAVRAEVKRGKN